MRVQGQYRFGIGRDKVWDALQDPQTLANTLPGVRSLEVIGPDRYKVSAKTGVGSVRGVFDGTFHLEDKIDNESCTLVGSARGAPGAADVRAQVRLSDADGNGTLLEYDADAKVTGALAGVGQRMMATAAQRTGEEFFGNIERAVTAPDAPPTEAPEEVPAAARAAPGAPAVGQVFASQRPEPQAGPLPVFAGGVVLGFVLALIGVAVGRWAARRP